jgi:ribosomal protein S12 methylthiotransferase accessory factor
MIKDFTEIAVSFPGGKKVDAQVDSFLIKTDQPVKVGGEGSAPAPFDLFLASMASCAGIFALGFCQTRNIQTDGLGLRMICHWDHARKLYTQVEFKLTLPTAFPKQHRESIIRAINLCAVKRHLMEAPTFNTSIED